MSITGTAHVVGDHIDTDAIIPARFLVTTDPDELGKNCMEGLAPGWIKRVSPGDILVGGVNFGCGSSREHAPIAIKGAGIPVVIAHSYARIFYRNGFNMGLPLMEIGEEIEKIGDKDELKVDLENGTIENVTKGVTIQAAPIPPFMQSILDTGGLVNYVKERLEAR